MSQRPVSRLGTPGPLDYDVKKTIGIGEGPAFHMAQKSPIKIGDLTPGPGEYRNNNEKRFKFVAYSIGREN